MFRFRSTDDVIAVLALILVAIFVIAAIRAFHQEITAAVLTVFGSAHYYRVTRL